MGNVQSRKGTGLRISDLTHMLHTRVKVRFKNNLEF